VGTALLMLVTCIEGKMAVKVDGKVRRGKGLSSY
jgi:hypothetical protein